MLNETDVFYSSRNYDIDNCGNMLLVYKTTNTYGTPQMFVHSVSVVSSLFIWMMDSSKSFSGMPFIFPHHWIFPYKITWNPWFLTTGYEAFMHFRTVSMHNHRHYFCDTVLYLKALYLFVCIKTDTSLNTYCSGHTFYDAP